MVAFYPFAPFLLLVGCATSLLSVSSTASASFARRGLLDEGSSTAHAIHGGFPEHDAQPAPIEPAVKPAPI